MFPVGTGWIWGHSYLCSASSLLQPATQNPKAPKCGFHKKLHQPELLFSACLISSQPPSSNSPISSKLPLWFLVILPLSFFQTLMIFLYTGINWGNGPQWLKLNYNHKSLVLRPKEGQFSLRQGICERGKIQYSMIWRNLWQGTWRNRKTNVQKLKRWKENAVM